MLSKSRSFFVSYRLKAVFEITEKVLADTEQSCSRLKPPIKTLTTYLSTRNDHLKFYGVKLFHSTHANKAGKKKDEVEFYDEQKSLRYYPEFERFEVKNKKTFLETIKIYKNSVKNRAGHVDFIKAALKNMKVYGVHRDLECYKKLIDVLPKGVYICSNQFLVTGMYFPRQQFVAMDLIQQMGNNGVLVDYEFGIILRNIFGREALPCKKYEDMFYWITKWKNKSPFLIPKQLPSDPFLLAKIAVERISSVDLQTEISVFQTKEVEESIDKTWIVSGQSPKQKSLLQRHEQNVPVIVEGGDLVWLNDKCISYFVLKSDGVSIPFKPPKDTDDISQLKSKFFNPNYIMTEESLTVHEQDDGKIYAVCATGTSSKDSLLSWVRILQKAGNPVLADVPVLFRLKQKETLPSPISEAITVQ